MSSGSSDELKATAKQYIHSFWKNDIDRDFNDEIKYLDGKKHQNPRPQKEIDQITQQLEYYANDLADEIVEELHKRGIQSLSDLNKDWKKLLTICNRVFPRYRSRFEAYVGRRITNR